MSDNAGEVVMGQSILHGSLKGIQGYPDLSGVLSRGMMIPDFHS